MESVSELIVEDILETKALCLKGLWVISYPDLTLSYAEKWDYALGGGGGGVIGKGKQLK